MDQFSKEDQFLRRATLRLAGLGGFAAVVVVIVAPYFLDIYTMNILIRALFLAALALTVDLLWGYTGILTFGQSAFFGIGAYACALVFSHYGFGPGWAVVALIIGVGVAALVAGLIGWLSFYHGASPLYASVITLALPIVAVEMIFSGGNFTGSSSGLSGFPTYYWSLEIWFIIAGVFLVLVTLIAWVLVRGDYGRVLVSIRENEDRCAYLGIPVHRIKIMLMVFCGATGAVAGFGYAAFTNVVAPELAGFLLGTELLIWVALGGRGTLFGPIFGTIGIDVTSSYLSGSLPFFRKLLTGITFVAVILLLPRGLAHVLSSGWQIIRKRKQHIISASKLMRIEPVHRQSTARMNYAPIDIQGVSRRYGSLSVLERVSFKGAAGQLLSIVGPNGAGKTTLMRCISNGTERTAGEVRIAGFEIGRSSPEKIVTLGVGRSFQNTSLFDNLTVADCFVLARYRIEGAKLLYRRNTIRLPGPALDILTATGLDKSLDTDVKHLSHGMKRALELAMVLATEPQVLLLDEPTAGLTKIERTAIGKVLLRLTKDFGMCILLIEHDLDFVRDVSSRILVLHQGKVLLDGNVDDVVSSDLVKSVYSGQVAEVK